MLCMNGKTLKKNIGNGWKVFVPIPGRGEASAAPFRLFLSHRQTPGDIKLKFSDFVVTFTVHIVAKKNISGNVSSGSPEQIT